MDTESPRLRLSILGIVAFSLFAALFARLWFLQIMATDQGEVEAANNRLRVIQEEAPRGRILDAKGRVLVDNRTSLVVTIDPHGLKDLKKDQRDDMLLRLATELTKSGVPTKVTGIEKRLGDPQYSPLQPIPVAIDVPETLMVFLAERADDFPSVQVRRETVRHYPEGSLAAHVEGYVGRISSTELEARMGTKEEPKVNPKPYEPDSDVGKTGIERTFEDDLRGIPGEITVEVDSKGRVKNEVGHKHPVPGNDVQLTLDIDVQRVTEQNLANELEGVRGTYTRDGKLAQGKAGSSVVIDPHNGNVVAMASYPTYDPSEFVNGISTDRYNQLVGGEAADNPLINRAIGGLYAPGSTFKLVTAYAALTKGLITGSTGYQDNGVYNVGNREFQNAGRFAHGWVPLPKAITVSSDVYFYWLGDRFWKERDKVGDGIQETARLFGYGQPTGVQLPGELGGVVPDPAWKKQFWQSLPADQQLKDGDKWYAGDNVNLAIGQGDLLATPIQVANAYATFVNHGVRHQTNLVLRVLKPGGDPSDPGAVVRSIDPIVASQFTMPDDDYTPLHTGLAGVTTDKDGTATEFFKGFDQTNFGVLGKTGTAEVKGKADTSIFVGVGPAQDPSYAAIAVLEQSGFGADAAGPVVRGVFGYVSGQDQAAACAAQADAAANQAKTANGQPAPTTTTTAKPGSLTVTCPDPPPDPVAPSTTTTTSGKSGAGGGAGGGTTGGSPGGGPKGGATTSTTRAPTATTRPTTTPSTSRPPTTTTRAPASTTPTTRAPTTTTPKKTG